MKTLLIIALTLAFAVPAQADIMLFNATGTSAHTNINDPIGQSFISDITDITWAGMFMHLCNCGGLGYDEIQYRMDIRDGDGTDGGIVASRTQTAPWGTSTGFYYFDFSGTTLALGYTYTAVITQLTPSPPPMGISTMIDAGIDTYAGGTAYWDGAAQPAFDMNFHLLSTVDHPMPPLPATEPTAALVMWVATLGLLVRKFIIA